MDNPIKLDLHSGKYIVWVSWWGVKIMKYFATVDEAIDFVKCNPKMCVDIRTGGHSAFLAIWRRELIDGVQPAPAVVYDEGHESKVVFYLSSVVSAWFIWFFILLTLDSIDLNVLYDDEWFTWIFLPPMCCILIFIWLKKFILFNR